MDKMFNVHFRYPCRFDEGFSKGWVFPSSIVGLYFTIRIACLGRAMADCPENAW
jgi:hypothetical protein